MPSRIGPAGTVRVAIKGQENGQNVVNVVWAKITPSGTVTQADLNTWLAAYALAFKTRFAPSITSSYSFQNAQCVYFVDGTALNTMTAEVTMTGAGSRGGTNENALAVVVSWVTSAYWRGGKPRTYLPATYADVDGTAKNNWNGTYLGTLLTAAGNFISDVNALTAGSTITATQFGFPSFFSGNSPRTPPVWFAITAAKLHPRVGSQRRRLGRWVT